MKKIDLFIIKLKYFVKKKIQKCLNPLIDQIIKKRIPKLYKIAKSDYENKSNVEDNIIEQIHEILKELDLKNLIVYGLRDSFCSHRYIHESMYRAFSFISFKSKNSIKCSWKDHSDNMIKSDAENSLFFHQ